MAQSGIATLLGLRGDKPEVPDFVPIDVTEEQKKAVLGNLANLPDIAQLGSATNKENAAQYLALLESLGLKGLYDQNTSNLESMARGELPKDVEEAIARRSAEAGVASGTSGSEFNKFGKLRNLGLTSLDLTQRALGSSAQWLASASIPQFNFTTMFQSPSQRIATEQWNKSMKWNRDWLYNQIKALPSNEEMAYAQMLDYVADFATMAAGVGMGSIGGGGGGGMMGGGGGGGGGGGSVGQYSAYGQNALVDSSSYGGPPPSYTPPPAPYTPPPSTPYTPPAYNYPNNGTMQPGGWGAP